MTFRILSLSGGGFMGFYTAVLLSEIEREFGRPIGQSFDLIAGTSIGGIIALGLAAGTPAQDIVSSFEANGQRIFSARSAARSPHQLAIDVLRHIRGAKYSPAALRQTVEEILGERQMWELSHRVLVPAVDIDDGRPQLFRTPHAPEHAGSLLALDVAMATSAAPTIFPLHVVGGKHYADGGVFAQSPDMFALTEAESLLEVPADEIEMLSIGTTTSAFDFGPVRSVSLGLTDWIENQRVLRMSWAMQQQAASMMVESRLGDRYLRIDTAQSVEISAKLGLDVASNEAREILRRMALAEIDVRMTHDKGDLLRFSARPQWSG